MKMKFLSVSAALILAGFISHAQTGQIRAGINMANVTVTENGRIDDANQLTSFQVGLIGDIKLGTSLLSLQPGVLFTGKGSKLQKGTPGQSGYFKQTSNPFYLEVPANLVFKGPIGKTSGFFAGAGPYIAMGIAGKVRTEGTNLLGQTYTREGDIQFSNDDPRTLNEEEGAGLGVIRRFDYGFNGTAGIEAGNLVLGVNYGLGLAKLQSGANNNQDNQDKHRVLSFTLGFKF